MQKKPRIPQHVRIVKNQGFLTEFADFVDTMRNEVSSRKKANLKLRIAVDLLGGEVSPQEWLHSLTKVRFPCPVDVYLFISRKTKLIIPSVPHMRFFPVKASTISMEDSPRIVRTKVNSSIVQGIRALEKKAIDGFLSTGNTGAIVAAASLYMTKFSEITRPALLAFLPTKKQPLAVIDVGANVDCPPNRIISFARLGIAAQQALGITNPKVALLNVGSEKYKGSKDLQSCYRLLEKFPNFSGNVEGNVLFEGNIDLLVTNGFTGNIILKSTEGLANFILGVLRKNITTYKLFPNTFIDGAILTGVSGMVMKCHGNSTTATITNAMDHFLKLIKKDFFIKYKEAYQKNFFPDIA